MLPGRPPAAQPPAMAGVSASVTPAPSSVEALSLPQMTVTPLATLPLPSGHSATGAGTSPSPAPVPVSLAAPRPLLTSGGGAGLLCTGAGQGCVPAQRPAGSAPSARLADPPEVRAFIEGLPEVVKLNVGGTYFHTSKETLLKDMAVGLRFSLLKANGEVHKDNEGYLFVDASPQLFELVLDFLRFGKCALPGGRVDLERLRLLAGKYQLEALEASVSERLREVEGMLASLVASQDMVSLLARALRPAEGAATLSGRARGGVNVPATNGFQRTTVLTRPPNVRFCSAPGNVGILGASTVAPAVAAMAGGAGSPPGQPLGSTGDEQESPPKKKRYFEYSKKEWESDEQFKLPTSLSDGSFFWPSVTEGSPKTGDHGVVKCKLCLQNGAQNRFTEGYRGGKKNALCQHQASNKDHKQFMDNINRMASGIGMT